MENNKNEPLLKISPKFDFIYELGMPTGKKIKSSIMLLIIFVIGFVIFCLFKDEVDITNVNGFNAKAIMYSAFIIAIIFAIVKLTIHIIMKRLQYKNIIYTFYSDHMTYEDNFLNQHKKNIKYENVKEAEIRRTVWDRILGHGIIVIYTNAENEYSNGLVIYGINEPQKYYDMIEQLVHSVKKENDLVSSSDDNNKDDKNDGNSEIIQESKKVRK